MRPRARKAPAPTPEQVVQDLVDIAVKGEDPGAAARAIVAARRIGVEPSADQLKAWLKRFETGSTASYRSLKLAVTTLEDADVLIEALMAAAAGERTAPPADAPWLDGFDWPNVPEEYRWTFLKVAIDDAANASQVSGDDDAPVFAVLGAYLEHVLPTLIPDPVDRLAWWLERARSVSHNRDTDINFGEEARSIADEWIDQASKGDLPTLLRIADILQRPVSGATGPVDKALDRIYARLRDAIPPTGPSRRRRRVSEAK